MIGFLILLLIAWAVLSIAGFVVKGLLWLAFVGLALFVITSLVLWVKNKAQSSSTSS